MPALLRSLTSNWKLKLLAFALAVLLWVVVSAEQVTSNWIPVPLQVRVDDPGFQLTPTSAPAEVEVRFAGPGRELWDLVVRRPPLVLNITNVDSTAATFGLEPGMVQVPSQMAVRALEVRPGAVTLDFDRVDSRLVPVRVRIGRGPAGGRTLVDSLEVRPARVRVVGLEQNLRGIDAVFTRTLHLDQADSVFTRAVALDTSALRGVRLSATRVQVSGRLDRLKELTLAQVQVSVSDSLSIRPREVSVRVRGSESRLQLVAPGSVRVVMALDSIPARLPAGGVAVPLRVEGLPAGLRYEVVPAAARLLPGGLLLDSIAVPRPNRGRDSVDAERTGTRG